MSDSIPMPQNHDVYWERWVDAYESDLESEGTSDDSVGEEDEYPPFPSEAEIDEILFPETGKINTIKTVFTPFGMLPLTEQSLASTHFKFWVGHTNFKLIRSFYSVIGRVKGVEAIDIFTPYRFRIAIGKLFRDRDVMSGVRKKMLEHLKVKNCPKNVP